jgi:hypothetical protein
MRDTFPIIIIIIIIIITTTTIITTTITITTTTITITTTIVIIIISYHRFPFLGTSSSTSGAPHHSGFNFEIVALFYYVRCP